MEIKIKAEEIVMSSNPGEDLTQKRCVPCEGGLAAFSKTQAQEYLKSLAGWVLRDDAKVIQKEFVMKNFTEAVAFIQRMAEVAEREGHHPDIHLTGYRKLVVELSTHAIKGLSENDFILAAKIEHLPKELKA